MTKKVVNLKNMIKKIFSTIKVLFNAEFVFNNPAHRELIIFDGESSNQLKHILKNFEYFVLETRFSRINKFYITRRIIFEIIKNYQKNLLSSYLLALIDCIHPKIVFTYIDNSYRFSEFSKLRNKKYKFVALQNGARYEHKIINKLIKKKNKNLKFNQFNIPYFLCFGDHEIKDYKKNKQKIRKFIKLGSLKLCNYLLQKKIKKKLRKNNDILLISDVNCWDAILDDLNFPVAEGVTSLIKFTIRFAIKNKLKLKIAARSYKGKFYEENNFYKKNLSEREYKYLIKNMFFRPNTYKTYEIMERSKVVVGTMSTMLRENLSIGGKTLACNFTKTEIFNFPIQGICTLNNCNYLNFETKLRKIIKMSSKNYTNSLSKNPSFLIHDKETINSVVLKLKSLLK